MFFADDIEGTPQHGSGIVHLAGFHRVHRYRNRRHPDIGQPHVRPGLARRSGEGGLVVLLAISVAGAIAYLLLGTVHERHHAPGGLYERIFLGLELR